YDMTGFPALPLPNLPHPTVPVSNHEGQAMIKYCDFVEEIPCSTGCSHDSVIGPYNNSFPCCDCRDDINCNFDSIKTNVGKDCIIAIKFFARPNGKSNWESPLISVMPNPFGPKTEINFVLSSRLAAPAINIYDIKGSLIRTYNNINLRNPVIWDARDNRGRAVPNGTYLIELQQEHAVASAKMILQR
ncbi:MAG: FlgD immunoglobulin-like domain containing protein, partial [bacterium]